MQRLLNILLSGLFSFRKQQRDAFIRSLSPLRDVVFLGFLLKAIIVSLFLFVSFSALNAQQSALDDSVSITLERTSLKDAIQEIASTSELRFAYRQKLIENKTQAPLSYSGRLGDLLDQVFNTHNLCYTLQNQQVIIHTACRPKYYSVVGYVIDSTNNEPIPYVSLSTPDNSKGIIADHEGYFEFKLKAANTPDTLILSCMGFQRDTLIVNSQTRKDLFVLMKPKIYELKEAIVRPIHYETIQLGNKKDNSIGSIYLDTHGQQAALFIQNKKNQAGYIESVEYFLSKKGNTKAPFRVRIYTVDSTGKPGDDLVEDVIVVKPDKSDGWCRIEIEKEQIPFPENGVFVAIEGVFPDDYDYYAGDVGFIDLKNTKQQNNKGLLSYGQRLGYNRKGRKDTWHYSMERVWFQIEKQAFGVMISANIKFEKNTDNYDQE